MTACLILVAAIVPPAVTAGDSTFAIQVEPGSRNAFDPDKATARVGAPGFVWRWDPPTALGHNVRQDDRLFYSGRVQQEGAFSESPSAGSYHYYCEVHGFDSGGMDGTVRVRPIQAGTIGDAFTVRWAEQTRTGDQFDVQFRVNGGAWRDWKKNADNLSGRFGRGDEPVDVKDGREYDFRARSEKSSNPSRRSGWSPRLEVAT